MSLSLARPMVADPGGLSGVRDPGRIAWIIFVARLPTSGGLLTGGAIWVFGWKFNGGAWGGAPAVATGSRGCRFGGGGWRGGARGIGRRPLSATALIARLRRRRRGAGIGSRGSRRGRPLRPQTGGRAGRRLRR